MGPLMTRLSLLCPAALLACLGAAAPAAAQSALTPGIRPVRQIASGVVQGDLRGTVVDDRGKPLAEAVVSAVGSTSAFAVSDRDGTFLLRNLPAGPYLLRAHLQGYAPTRGRMIQISIAASTASAIVLTRRSDTTDAPPILEAGIGPSATSGESAAEPEVHDVGEVAWRLRHLKRSVLKDATFGGAFEGERAFLDDPFDGVGRAIGSSARLAGAWFADLSLNGQINLLTRTSFDRPQDLFSLNGVPPTGVTYLSLSAPTIGGEWTMRGAVTQGELSSWILSGAYARRTPAAHQYEAGVSYGTQQYLGGSADALTAISGGARSVGAAYAYDNWTVSPAFSVTYGAKYARYEYLDDRGLLSPTMSVTIAPVKNSSFRLHGSASRREIAPGAEEFLPPSTGLWLPPERTFSPLTPFQALSAERIDRLEVSAERQWVGDFMIGLRAFRENVDDQVVTLFGTLPNRREASISHYYVGSGGDFDAVGWGLSVSRNVAEGLRASIDYTQTDAEWVGASPERARISRVSASATRAASERIHDLTASVESEVAATATRIVVVYKINSAFASADSTPGGSAGTRFNVEVNQALPFLNFASAQWEVLVAVRNLFSDDFRNGSVYDELLVVRPPKRVMGGLTVRF